MTTIAHLRALLYQRPLAQPLRWGLSGPHNAASQGEEESWLRRLPQASRRRRRHRRPVPGGAGNPCDPGGSGIAGADHADRSVAHHDGVANGSNHGTKLDLQAIYQAVVNALETTFYQPTDTFQWPRGTYTRDELVGELQGIVAAAQATKSSNRSGASTCRRSEPRDARARASPGREGINGARFGASGAAEPTFRQIPLPRPERESAQTEAPWPSQVEATRSERNMGRSRKRTSRAT